MSVETGASVKRESEKAVLHKAETRTMFIDTWIGRKVLSFLAELEMERMVLVVVDMTLVLSAE